ncbi:hypothetical protein P8452_21430 [Trifolium repens]|nr:hypothetical protein P8452_21430 [Trifolium repens]
MASQDEAGKTIDQSIVSVINGFIQIQVFSCTGDFAAGVQPTLFLQCLSLLKGSTLEPFFLDMLCQHVHVDHILEDIINDHNEAKSRVAKLVWGCSFGRCMENSKDLLDYYFTAKFRF